MKVIVNIFITLGLLFILVGCAHLENTPMNVTFKNGSYLHSPNYSITAVYQEDKRIRDYSTDILIQSSEDNTTLKLTKELGATHQIFIENKDTWYSLTDLIGGNLNFATFAKVQSTTYIINSVQKLTLKLKAIGGEVAEIGSTGQKYLTNTFDVSKPLKLKIETIIPA